MTSNATSPAKKTYCVWADYVRRMCQHVEATSPQEAYDIAKEASAWEPCDWHDNNSYRLSNEVQDLETEEFTPILGSKHCKNCGSEIVETVNDSNFRDGECGPCEYERYKQPRTPGAFFTMVEEDLHMAAEEKIGRRLTADELRSAIKNFEHGINWHETAEIAVDLAVDDHSHGNAL